MLLRCFPLIVALALGAVSAQAQERRLSTDDIRDTIETAAMMMDGYVIAEKREAVAAALRDRAAAGDYDAAGTWPDLAARLGADLVELTDDLHFAVTYDPDTIASWNAPVEEDEDQLAEYRRNVAEQWRARGQGVRQAALLPGGVGYIRLDYVAPPSEDAVALWDAAFRLVGDADALILDVRANRGGSPEGVADLIGRFMGAEPVRYARIESAHEAPTDISSTPGDPETSFLDRPVFVLISRHTGSAGEAVAYHLRALDRATLIGETTAGGAHPTSVYSINDFLILRMPTERVVSTVTGANWEGAGVAPDIATSFDAALPRAKLAAVDAIEAGDPAETFADARAWLRAAAEGELSAWSPSSADLEVYAGDVPGVGEFVVRGGDLRIVSDGGEVPLRRLAPGVFQNLHRDEIIYRFDVPQAHLVTLDYSDGREFVFERDD